MRGIKVNLEIYPVKEDGSTRDLPTGRMVVWADDYDQALTALLKIRRGEIRSSEIPKTGLDLRTKPNGGAMDDTSKTDPNLDTTPQRIENPEPTLEDFADCLGEYQCVQVDSTCGEPVAYGHPVTQKVGEERWALLGKLGRLEFNPKAKTWALVTDSLTRELAEVHYGPCKGDKFGPRGGWQSVTFGEKTFTYKGLKP